MLVILHRILAHLRRSLMAIGGEEANWSVYELEQTRDPVQALCEDYAVAFVDWTREKEAVHSQLFPTRYSLHPQYQQVRKA
ncbi:hypothetical protein EMWEY_00016760 [Eimeria maxima]|uniref:Uncharacterized protein n=1 Tax=Eimeria maxima TaxID=5804 RepID=U6MAC7_EIMMA|nr:hypothetical protein EMWEY_00016760 [Eimeria maxima]CDJ58590.1 hypothetical protein EMWEY_00016760 [Eimeria maxima]